MSIVTLKIIFTFSEIKKESDTTVQKRDIRPGALHCISRIFQCPDEGFEVLRLSCKDGVYSAADDAAAILFPSIKTGALPPVRIRSLNLSVLFYCSL